MEYGVGKRLNTLPTQHFPDSVLLMSAGRASRDSVHAVILREKEGDR